MNILKMSLLIAGVGVLWSCSMEKQSRLNYPLSVKGDTIDTYFGRPVADPYRWLEDDQSEQTKAWVEAQNKVTSDYLSTIPYRQQIHKRLTDIWNYPRMGVPFIQGGYYFYSRNNGLQNQNVYFVQRGEQGESREILDPNKLSEAGTVALSNFSVSKDGQYLGYGISTGGSDWNELFVKNIETNETLTDHLKWVKFSEIAWQGNGFYYSRYPQPKAGDQLKGENIDCQICFHRVGTPQSEDLLIYEDKVNRNWGFSAEVSEDEKYLVISVTESTSGNAVYYKDLSGSNSQMVKAVTSFDSDFIFVGHLNGKLLFLTNHSAPRYRLVGIDPKKPSVENWHEIISQHPTDVLQEVSSVGGQLFAVYQHDAHSQVVVCDATGKMLYPLELPGLGTVTGFYGEAKDSVTYYSFSSYTYPSVIYKYHIAENRSEVHYQTKIDFDLNNYETRQVFYKSQDGTSIPMFLVHKKGIKQDGKNPVWLYGYGGFNISLTPGFDVRRLVWLENGGIFAVANLRGGGEYGEAWHRAGTLLKKQNVFDDFVGAARYLIDEGYTSPKQIVAQGGSNGGLLIGAVVNQHPELFAAAFPQVGVLDMLRYHKFTIGRYWATDYGTSEQSEEMFTYLMSYSPLHNIRENIDYPPIMVTTADHDDRVVPAHSFKYIATMQEKYQGTNPVIIRIDINAGHGAGKPVSKLIDEWADVYSFAFKQLKMDVKY